MCILFCVKTTFSCTWQSVSFFPQTELNNYRHWHYCWSDSEIKDWSPRAQWRQDQNPKVSWQAFTRSQWWIQGSNYTQICVHCTFLKCTHAKLELFQIKQAFNSLYLSNVERFSTWNYSGWNSRMVKWKRQYRKCSDEEKLTKAVQGMCKESVDSAACAFLWRYSFVCIWTGIGVHLFWHWRVIQAVSGALRHQNIQRQRDACIGKVGHITLSRLQH